MEEEQLRVRVLVNNEEFKGVPSQHVPTHPGSLRLASLRSARGALLQGRGF